MVEFFDLISFFGVAAFFAWLAYVPLQSRVLEDLPASEKAKITPEKVEKTKRNFHRITDYFFLSFLSFCVAAVSDYVFHHRFLVSVAYAHAWVPFFVLGTTSVFGLSTLLVPMIYVRMVGRGGRGLGDIDLPPVMVTFYVTFLIAIGTVLSVIDFAISQTIIGMGLSLFAGLMCCVFGVRIMKDRHDRGWRGFLNIILVMSPAYVMFLLAGLHALPL